ncbi:MAG TPA: VWA domain-containing protein, partial [Verrucomicrobiae bacterium]|nr:VWA domain-containing protein [Verrucomicrobiae bacterium]
MFQFTHPQWLWLLPPALAWVWWLARSSYVHASPGRRWVAGGTRFVVTVALILAIAGFQWRTAIREMSALFILDRSDSVPSAQQEQARQWVSRAAADKKSDDRAGLVVFGSEASIEASPSIALNAEKIETVVPAGRTDIASALRLATAAFPERGQRRAVLLSDGN